MQRQYTGTAGRIENAQVAVYLTYAGARGVTRLIDRRAVPAEVLDRGSRPGWPAAGVPDDVEFATKPALAHADDRLPRLNAGVLCVVGGR